MFFFLVGFACILGMIMLYKMIMLYMEGVYWFGFVISHLFNLPLWIGSAISMAISSLIIGLFMIYEMKHALQVDDNYEKTAIEDEDEDDLF